ncbi:MAG TPA: MoaD/ThiS family protein, partial [Thermodesulfobacteriota bacterium]|nr:MoaD/ThiS family protein [Thermodesulfobacteriota bacterium]
DLPGIQSVTEPELRGLRNGRGSRGMSVRVEIHRIFQEFTKGRKTAEVKGNTVGECLKDLALQFPALEGKLIDQKGRLVNNLEIYINQESAYPDELKKSVCDGDVVHIVMMIDGG